MRLLSACLAAFTVVAFAEPASPAPDAATAPSLHYTVSWFGNTFAEPNKWVQMDAHAMYTAPDGTCYLNTFWEEGGRNVGIYKNGDVVGNAGHTHGWGYEGGDAVTANDRYLFIAQQVGNEGGGLKAPTSWPPKGWGWSGVSRRHRDGTPAPFPGGKGGDGDTLKSCFLTVYQYHEKTPATITGMAADAHRLYVVLRTGKDNVFNVDEGIADGKICVYNVETMEKVTEWDLPHAAQVALAPDGSLWIIQGASARNYCRIVHRKSDGTALPDMITGGHQFYPAALCVDKSGNVLVADNGPDQQVKVFIANRKFHYGRALGVKGGILVGRKGQVGPLRFNGLTGVGVDRDDNIYVCSRNSGVALQSYRAAGTLNWELLGLEFVDSADADPGADTNVYTKEEHFVLDYSKPRGHEWSYRGFTRDWLHYPDDPRAHAEFASAIVRRIQGKRILFGIDMYADHLMMFRFNGQDEIAIPCGYIAQKHINSKDNWPPQQPEKGEWIWRDANGDGDFDAGEYDSHPTDNPSCWGWWVDDKGDIWQAGDANTIRHLPCQGLDAIGSPIYSFVTAKTEPAPAPFTNLQRIEYEPATDTMYLSGYSAEHANTKGNWKTVGKIICRYDHWSTTKTKRWEIDPPFDEAQEASRGAGTPVAMSVAGDYLFVVYLKTAEIRVYDTAGGTYRGTLQPGKDLSGWVDLPYGVRAMRRADGEYIIFVEEDAKAKGLMYRWRPGVG